MSFLTPAALAVAVALPAAILVMHLLRGSRKRRRVPATFLWADLPPGLSGRERRRPPLSLLLLLQLAAAIAIGLALARPAVTAGSPPRHVVLVLDASASMQATDVAPSRFEMAKGQAMQRISRLGAGDTVGLVRAGAIPELLASDAPEHIRDKLMSVRPGGGGAALQESIALASQQIASTPDRPGEIFVFTDGAFPTLAQLGTLAAPVEFVPVGGTAGSGNQAIVDVQIRAQPSGTGVEAYVEVANYDSVPVSVPVRVRAADSAEDLDTPTVAVLARGTSYFVIAVPASTPRLRVELADRPADSLSLDDAVEMAVPSTGERPRDVALVSDDPTTFQRALQAIPSVRLSILTPAGFDSTIAAPDLTILDSFVPEHLPPGPLLIVNPPPANDVIPAALTVQSEVASTFDAANPLLYGLDVTALRFDPPSSLQTPRWARTVAGTARGPLILEGHRDGRPVVVFGFDPLRNAMDKAIAFPLLVSNAVSYLLAGGQAQAIAPGEIVKIPVSPSGHAVLVRPDGQRERLSPQDNEFQITDTDQPGRYTVFDGANETMVLKSFSVNMLDSVESDILPRRDLEPINLGISPAANADRRTDSVLDEWWRLLIAAAVGLVGLEWFIFSRRG